jgi:hypothetical protein
MLPSWAALTRTQLRLKRVPDDWRQTLENLRPTAEAQSTVDSRVLAGFLSQLASRWRAATWPPKQLHLAAVVNSTNCLSVPQEPLQSGEVGQQRHICPNRPHPMAIEMSQHWMILHVMSPLPEQNGPLATVSSLMKTPSDPRMLSVQPPGSWDE